MNANSICRQERLIIFTRYPVPGKTKTRLIHELGRAGAADIQRRFTENILDTAKGVASGRGIDLEVRFEGGNVQKMRRWLGPDFIFSSQPQGGLGLRMRTSFEEAFRRGCRRVVLIGSDIPEMTAAHIEKAFDALNGHDIVLGPSTDGGYWLIGMKAAFDIFYGIDWSTSSVFDQTCRLVDKLGLNSVSIEPLTDIDTFDELKKWDFHEANGKPYISVIIPALDEEKSIVTAISSARNRDAEIIVVDGGSSDNTVNKAIAAGALVETGPRGRASQQNLGAESARGKVILFLHADTVLPDGYVDYVFEALMDTGIVGGAFRFRTDWDHPMMKTVGFMTNLRARYLNQPYGDQALFVRKSVFSNIGGFPDVPIAEDLLFVRRLVRKGGIRIVPAVAVTSARRWKRMGILRTTLTNQLIAVNCLIGVTPRLLAFLYRGRNKE
jgi:uncharacterized protein